MFRSRQWKGWIVMAGRMKESKRKPMKKGVIVMGAMTALFLGYALQARADDDPKRVEKGIRFNVPPDWPVEEKGGGLAPMPVEEYVLKRFKEVEGRIEELQKLKEDLTGKTQATADPQFQNDIATKLDIISAQFKSLSDDVGALKAGIQELKENRSKVSARLDALDKSQAEMKKLLNGLEERINFLRFQMKL